MSAAEIISAAIISTVELRRQGNTHITTDKEAAIILAALRADPVALADLIPEGHVRLVGRVWRVDVAVNSEGQPVVEATDDDHGVLARLVPIEDGATRAETAAPYADPADDGRCPHCGGEPDDPDNHLSDCPTIDTCAQCEPDLAEPWHPESEWFDGHWRTYSRQLNEHIRDAHRTRLVQP